jgi:hypothetical protein
MRRAWLRTGNRRLAFKFNARIGLDYRPLK